MRQVSRAAFISAVVVSAKKRRKALFESDAINSSFERPSNSLGFVFIIQRGGESLAPFMNFTRGANDGAKRPRLSLGPFDFVGAEIGFRHLQRLNPAAQPDAISYDVHAVQPHCRNMPKSSRAAGPVG